MTDNIETSHKNPEHKNVESGAGVITLNKFLEEAHNIFSKQGSDRCPPFPMPGAKGHESVDNLPRIHDAGMGDNKLNGVQELPPQKVDGSFHNFPKGDVSKLPHVVIEGFGVCITNDNADNLNKHPNPKTDPRNFRPTLD